MDLDKSGWNRAVRTRARDAALIQRLRLGIRDTRASGLELPGIANPIAEEVLIGQLIDSVRRVKYVSTVALRQRALSPMRADPSSPLFDPLKGAMVNIAKGEVDEACWLVFLFVHFGRHPKSRWRYAREVYGALGDRQCWTWARVSADPEGFRTWLRGHEGELTRGRERGFSNHRKYVSISADGDSGTGAAVASYVQWVMGPGGHQALFATALGAADGAPGKAFNLLYRSMRVVRSFGRMATFDYLTMIGKLQIANISPRSAYIAGSTGPKNGARKLFQRSDGPIFLPAELDRKAVEMSRFLDIGMQEMEDAICNWQKSPMIYRYFGG
jgi:Alpha-glutamyl/putrescinyl thymine pyrophosphorylase clade 3